MAERRGTWKLRELGCGSKLLYTITRRLKALTECSVKRATEAYYWFDNMKIGENVI